MSIAPNNRGNEILFPRLKYNEIKRLLMALLCQWSLYVPLGLTFKNSLMFLTEKVWVQSQRSPFGICGRLAVGKVFRRLPLDFPVIYVVFIRLSPRYIMLAVGSVVRSNTLEGHIAFSPGSIILVVP